MIIKNFSNFNENNSELSHNDILADVRELCKLYLSYLSDSNFSVYVTDFDRDVNIYNKVLDPKVVNKGVDYRKVIRIGISKSPSPSESDSLEPFYWNEVSDDFIPFIEVLTNTYKIEITLREKAFIGYDYKDYSSDNLSSIPEYKKVKNVFVYIK